jgi:hypothetical protein
VFEKAPLRLARPRGDLSQPDDGLNGFNLAEERAEIVELVMTLML